MIDVARPAEAPLSLSEKKSYKDRDVLEALHRAFLGKCYLCETPIMVGTFEVDHRKPKAPEQFPELEFAWTNLFPTCNTHRCNQRRERRYPEGGLLDPSAEDKVEARLLQRIEGFVSGVLAKEKEALRFVFEASSSEDIAARNTARELDRIHNGKGSGEPAQYTAFALRSAIHAQVFNVAKVVCSLELLPPEAAEQRAGLREELRKLLSRRAPYTMLVRSYFRHRPELRELFD